MDAIFSPATSADSSTTSLFDEQLAQIRTDLAAIPAPPWRWIGVRGSGGPQLVTDHSGRQYLLRAAKPVDEHGNEILEPDCGYVVYGDLEFRDQRADEKYSTMRTGNQLAVGRTSYAPDSIVDVDNPVARWMERSATHVQTLLAEIDRLRAASTEFECPMCNRWAAWTNGRSLAAGDPVDEFWCQSCGTTVNLSTCTPRRANAVGSDR